MFIAYVAVDDEGNVVGAVRIQLGMVKIGSTVRPVVWCLFCYCYNKHNGNIATNASINMIESKYAV